MEKLSKDKSTKGGRIIIETGFSAFFLLKKLYSGPENEKSGVIYYRLLKQSHRSLGNKKIYKNPTKCSKDIVRSLLLEEEHEKLS